MFREGPVIKAMRKGAVLLLDEVDLLMLGHLVVGVHLELVLAERLLGLFDLGLLCLVLTLVEVLLSLELLDFSLSGVSGNLSFLTLSFSVGFMRV